MPRLPLDPMPAAPSWQTSNALEGHHSTSSHLNGPAGSLTGEGTQWAHGGWRWLLLLLLLCWWGRHCGGRCRRLLPWGLGLWPGSRGAGGA